MEYSALVTLVAITIIVGVLPVKVMVMASERPFSKSIGGNVGSIESLDRAKRFTLFPQFTVLQVSIC